MESLNSSVNYNDILDSCRIYAEENVEQPPIAIMINSESGQIPSFTLGNFSLIIGKAKSKKTFFVGVLAAAALSGRTMVDKVQGVLLEQKRKVLYFDTEQSRYHANKTVRRILSQTDEANIENLLAYSLRKFPPSVRKELIETSINSHDDVGLVIIDGGRDLLSLGINDEKQATELTNSFLRWTAEKQLHLILVLHQNKNDNNARGHFGTECINKAEVVISLTAVGADSNISIVDCEYSRDLPFERFAFMININGIPEYCNLPSSTSGQRISLHPSTINETVHHNVLSQIFDGNGNLNYGLLVNRVQEVVGNQISSIGINRAKEYVKYYLRQGLIRKDGRLYSMGS